MGGEDFVKNGRQQYKCKACDISSTNAPSCPRLSLSACKATNNPPFFTLPAPADPLSPPSAVVRLTPKPVVQLLVRNLYTQLPPTPRHHLPYRPKPPLQYRLRHPPLPGPYFWPHSLICASIPPASYPFTHCYAHALLLPPLSPASIAPLAVTTTIPATPSLSRLISLACKAPKTPPQGASMQSSNEKGDFGRPRPSKGGTSRGYDLP